MLQVNSNSQFPFNRSPDNVYERSTTSLVERAQRYDCAELKQIEKLIKVSNKFS